MINRTRLEWNATIERLIESSGEDAEARMAIASLGATLRPMKGLAVDAGIGLNADHVSGATPEHGNIEIDPGGTEKKSLRLGLGTVERIGYYKISRLRHRRFLSLPYEDLILIHHHWKSDLTTGSETEPPEAWCLCCDPQMEPVWFGRIGYRIMRWGWLSVIISEIQELWGPNPDTLHPPLNVRLALRS
jgi:hypothetical protein